jgi:hypothetical protein
MICCPKHALNKIGDLIDNSNIDKSQLNNYGLHLNKKGCGSLARNIKLYLNH